MNALFKRIDRWRLAALLLWTVPVLALLPLGMLWLRQEGVLLVWLAALVVFSATGYGVQFWLRRREQAGLAAGQTQPNPDWSPEADAAWALVEAFAGSLEPDDWPLGDGQQLGLLAQRTLEQVAGHFHPDVDRPLLELTLPHALLIVERASRDLRDTITDNIPYSHRLSVGTLVRAYRWKPFAERLLGLYRAGRWVINPAHAALNEAWEHLRGRGYAMAQKDLSRWLLRETARKVGRYAIDLYSGRLLLTDEDPVSRATEGSIKDLTIAAESAIEDGSGPAGEPLRILVLGRANAGKSSLVNALFGQLRAATDLAPETTRALTPYRLEREGLEIALILDAPGVERLAYKSLHEAANAADLILWVSAAHRPDRQSERQTLDALRTAQSARVGRRPPPLLVAVTHIDRLRPLREWQPPYDLTDSRNLKAMSIQAAVTALATDLEVPIASVIPVCLAEGRVYNVEDTLWAALLGQLDRARRARLLRCQDERHRNENWMLLRRQLANAGRFLLALPGRF